MYSCPVCNTSLNSQSQWEQHIPGAKHQRKLKEKQIVDCFNLVPTSSSKVLCGPSGRAENDNSESFLIGPDGSYKCKICPGFVVSGIIPMRDHLKGVKHFKALRQQGLPTGNLHNLTPHTSAITCNQPLPSITQLPKNSSVVTSCEAPEVRLAKAWKHDISCRFDYHIIETLPIEAKFQASSPHFALISKNEPIPKMIDYLR